MTEREYQGMLEVVQDAINAPDSDIIRSDLGDAPVAANDNGVEWPLMPFPEGWPASP